MATIRSRSMHHFTLLEIILALMVIAVGIVAIMGLFPLSMRTHRSAMTESQVAAMADEVVQLAILKVKSGFNPVFVNEVTAKNNVRDTEFSPLLFNQWQEYESMNGYEYRYSPKSYDFKYEDTGLLRIHRTHVAKRDGKTVTVSDADVVFAIWQENAEYVGIDLETGDAVNKTDDAIVRLTVEASWPAAVPYEDRQIMTFVTEVNP